MPLKTYLFLPQQCIAFVRHMPQYFLGYVIWKESKARFTHYIICIDAGLNCQWANSCLDQTWSQTSLRTFKWTLRAKMKKIYLVLLDLILVSCAFKKLRRAFEKKRYVCSKESNKTGALNVKRAKITKQQFHFTLVRESSNLYYPCVRMHSREMNVLNGSESLFTSFLVGR